MQGPVSSIPAINNATPYGLDYQGWRIFITFTEKLIFNHWFFLGS